VSPVTKDATVVVGAQQLSSSVGEEAVILGLTDGVYYGLNSVGARIWALLQEPRRAREVCAAITTEFEVDAESCERDVIRLLQQLADKGLVEVRA